jgi:hypothetical protein
MTCSDAALSGLNPLATLPRADAAGLRFFRPFGPGIFVRIDGVLIKAGEPVKQRVQQNFFYAEADEVVLSTPPCCSFC